MQLNEIVTTSRGVAATGARLAKVERLADCLVRLEPAEVPIAVAYLSGEPRQGRIGVGHATLRSASPGRSTDTAALTLADVDATFERIATVSGPGSQAKKVRLLNELLARATPEEQNFLARLLLGELRQGALEGVMQEAIARAAGVPAAGVRRAVMLTGDLPGVARAALSEGTDGLSRLSVQLFRPIKPMLAQPAEDLEEALATLGRAALEHKLDGARIQVHRQDEEIAVYTRRLNDVTTALPEVVEAARGLPAGELILDGEVLAFGEDGRPLPFQTTMRRFGRRLDVERLRSELPITPFFFDCLYRDGESLIDAPARERFAALAEVAGEGLVIPRIETDEPERARAFLDAALAAGHEGIMAKSLDAPYKAGGRGQAWLKVKPVHTLDLVVLAAEWGHGRRRGWLSNLHLGARDPEHDRFVMLGKTFKGMTDEMLEWQTEQLQQLATRRDGHIVGVRPELVVEVAFNDVQESPQYPAGMALRFARVKRYRPDKGPEEANTVEDVRRIHEG